MPDLDLHPHPMSTLDPKPLASPLDTLTQNRLELSCHKGALKPSQRNRVLIGGSVDRQDSMLKSSAVPNFIHEPSRGSSAFKSSALDNKIKMHLNFHTTLELAENAPSAQTSALQNKNKGLSPFQKRTAREKYVEEREKQLKS